MFDQFRLKEVLAQYKQNFVSTQWGNEKYKWEAVKWFQDNWDVNAQNFPEMLNRSLDKTFNLLASNNNFPKGMIVGFAKAAPEEVRAMFIALFDESKDVYERMNAFKLQSSILLEKYGNGAAQHYQYENAISTYLWLRYPDKYYIYKFGEVKTVASELESDYCFKKGAYADNIRNFLKLYALRRRFSFFEMESGFDSEGFIHYQNWLNNETLNELVNKVKDLNREISLDKSLGKGFCIGHSYFCGRDVCTEEWLHSIVDYEILPMLSEYWFDDANKLQRWENILQGVFQ